MNYKDDIHLHIITFDIPYPADYGGVIDIYYKIKALHEMNVKIHLHCFEYGRKQVSILNQFCETVNYYKRNTGFLSFLHVLPYIVFTRRSDLLMKNLLRDDHPILFEGLHTTHLLDDNRLKDRFKIVRCHNIEHDYYLQLSNADTNYIKKIFFLTESKKLAKYEGILNHANSILAISKSDESYLKKKYKNVIFVSAFHSNLKVEIREGIGNYILYHGNLSVGENIKAAEYLINNVFSKLNIPAFIAGHNPPESLCRHAAKFGNIVMLPNPSDEHMHELIANAQINIMISFQNTGLKLKLLNALFVGRHCLVNTPIIKGTGLESLCIIGDTPEELNSAIQRLFYISFSSNLRNIEIRKEILYEQFSNIYNALKIINLIS
jgi:hypothetical protein